MTDYHTALPPDPSINYGDSLWDRAGPSKDRFPLVEHGVNRHYSPVTAETEGRDAPLRIEDYGAFDFPINREFEGGDAPLLIELALSPLSVSH
jgi:hypothetical protein